MSGKFSPYRKYLRTECAGKAEGARNRLTAFGVDRYGTRGFKMYSHAVNI